MARRRDPLEQYLLDLDGRYFQYEGGYYAKFVFQPVPESQRKPHGFDYSLTFHRKDGERILGFDNAHAAPKGRGPAAKSKRPVEYDHKHLGNRTYQYQYVDLTTLLEDFWDAVDKALKKER
jgi:hypothetical protein